MKKTNDPYQELWQLNQRGAEAMALQRGAEFATIVSPPPEIKINYRGMILDKSWLYIDKLYLQNYARTAKGHIVSATQNRGGGGGYAEFESHNHAIDNDYTDTIIYTDTWKVGDKVMVLPIFGDDGKTVKQYAIWGQWVRLDGAN